MQLRRLTGLLLAGFMTISLIACGSSSQGTAESSPAAEAPAAEEAASDEKETPAAGETAETAADASADAAADAAVETDSAEVPSLEVSWNNDLHNGIMQLTFLIPEEFESDAIHFAPVSDTQFDLVKDGKVIAHLNKVQCKGASEAAALMSQGHLDISYCSSTGMLSAYDSGTDVCILCPVQSGGVSIAAAADAPYDTFEGLVEHAKNSETPIMAG